VFTNPTGTPAKMFFQPAIEEPRAPFDTRQPTPLGQR
jgi:hypothetical protein